MKRLLLFAIAAIMFASCSNEFTESQQQSSINIPEKIYAEIDDATTRTYVEAGNQLRWSEGDEISYFPTVSCNIQYRFDGKTGDNGGSFTMVNADKLYTGNELENTYALYPYNEYSRISDEGVIYYTLPSVQKYAKNSFGLGANAMVAVTNDNILRFKNLCGYIKIKCYGEDIEVASITLQGNNNETLAGYAHITATLDNDPVLNITKNEAKSITLQCDSPVTTGDSKENATEFWFVVPSQTFENGITVKITLADDNETTIVQSTDNPVVVDRNTIQPMTAFEIINANAEPKPANNQIWYTSHDDKMIEINSYLQTNSGITVTSHTYENGLGVITFDGDITTVGWTSSSLKSMILPKSVTSTKSYYAFGQNIESITFYGPVSINKSAFEGCDSLKEVNIKKAVEILSNAFLDATALETITIPASLTRLDYNAFKGCTSLSSVYFKSPTPPSIGSTAFDNNATGRKIYVPIGARDAYATYWSLTAYANDIVEAQF